MPLPKDDWVQVSQRKHKKWSEDGVLVVRGLCASLRNLEDRVVASGSNYAAADLRGLHEDSTLIVGSFEVMILEQIAWDEFTSGRCFSASSAPATAPPAPKALPSAVSRAFVCPLADTFQNAALQRKAAAHPAAPLYNPDAAGALVMDRPGEDHIRRYNSAGAAVSTVVVDPRLSRDLRPHQRDGVRFLYNALVDQRASGHHGAILGDEMGLGKTLQTIAVVWTLLKQAPYGSAGLLKRVLIVCPSSLVPNWRAEFRKWLGDERLRVFALAEAKELPEFGRTLKVNPVLILSYEAAGRAAVELGRLNFDLLVCDEAHRLKNAESKTYASLASLAVRRRLLITGTPVQNDLSEFFALVDFVSPGLLGSAAAFRRICERPIVAGRRPGASEEEKLLARTRNAELQVQLRPHFLRRTAAVNEAYLLPKHELVLFCRPSALQAELYTQVGRGLLASVGAASGAGLSTKHLGAIDTLRKLCNHPVLLQQALATKKEELDADAEALLRLFPQGYEDAPLSLEESGKLAVLVALLQWIRQTAPGEKVVVVSAYRRTLDLIQSVAEALGHRMLRLDGETSRQQRQDAVKAFNRPEEDTFLFLLSLKAGGCGLNLIGASRLVLFETDWNPAHDRQAMARIWRDGQRRDCHIYRLVTTGTLEERQLQRQLTKTSLSDEVVDRDGGGGAPKLSAEEMRDLFRLHRHTDSLVHHNSACRCDCAGGPCPSASSSGLADFGHFRCGEFAELGGLAASLPADLPPQVSFVFAKSTKEKVAEEEADELLNDEDFGPAEDQVGEDGDDGQEPEGEEDQETEEDGQETEGDGDETDGDEIQVTQTVVNISGEEEEEDKEDWDPANDSQLLRDVAAP